MVCIPQYLEQLVLGRLFTENMIHSADDVESVYVCRYGNTAMVKPIPWRASWIFDRADDFEDGMPLHSQTVATHSTLLARGGQRLFSCEDIGQHNALDKVIGYALMQGIDTPLVPVEELRWLVQEGMERSAAATILEHRGKQESLIGLYRTDLAEEMVREIAEYKGSVFAFLRRVGYEVYRSDASEELFVNVNHPEIYDHLQGTADDIYLKNKR